MGFVDNLLLRRGRVAGNVQHAAQWNPMPFSMEEAQHMCQLAAVRAVEEVKEAVARNEIASDEADHAVQARMGQLMKDTMIRAFAAHAKGFFSTLAKDGVPVEPEKAAQGILDAFAQREKHSPCSLEEIAPLTLQYMRSQVAQVHQAQIAQSLAQAQKILETVSAKVQPHTVRQLQGLRQRIAIQHKALLDMGGLPDVNNSIRLEYVEARLDRILGPRPEMGRA